VTPDVAVQAPTALDPLSEAEPWQTYARCRAQPAPYPAGDGSWYLFGYDDVRKALTDPAFTVDMPFRTTRRAFGPSMVDIDGPAHKKLRRGTALPLQARVQEAPAVIEHLAGALLDELPDGEPVDLVTRFAILFPVQVFCWVMGLPTSDASWWYAALRPLIDHVDQGTVGVSAVTAQRRRLIDEMQARLTADAVDRRGLLPFLAGVREDLDVSPVTILSNSLMLMAAGTETTGLAIANLAARLLSEPDTLAALRRDPGLAPCVVQESLRIDPPLHAVLRIAGAGATVGDITLPAGASVQVCLASANRDPRYFTEPDTWSPGRHEVPALTFGSGRHSCLGSNLAVLELETAVRVLLDRTADIRPAGPVPRPAGYSFRGVRTLPVRVTKRVHGR
jgi:cytochrome P450